MEDRDNQPRWYVVHTYSGYENKVSQDLATAVENRRMQDLIQEIKVPTEIVTEVTDGKEREVERKLFPGYVLVKMIVTDESWYIVRNTRGVTGFIGDKTTPIPLSDAEVEKLGVESHSAELDFSVGESIQITEGPMAGFVGNVEEIDLEHNRVKVTVSMFGRETPAELDFTQVKPL